MGECEVCGALTYRWVDGMPLCILCDMKETKEFEEGLKRFKKDED